MKNQTVLILAFCFLGFSCSEKSDSTVNSNEWDLVIEDSIQVDYLGNIREGIFAEGYGVFKDSKNNALIKFDSTGKILIKKEFPREGPGSILFMESIHFDNGLYFGTSSFNGIFKFSSGLELMEKLEMPFIGQGRGGPINLRNLEIWGNKILLWYPGRDEISPYQEHFFRDHMLLELFDPKTKNSVPLIRTPQTSKFSLDEFFIQPAIQFSVEGDSLYFTFNNEDQVHVFTLPDGKWIRSMSFTPTEFKLFPGQNSPVTGPQRSSMREGRISGIYSNEKNLFLTYSGGIDSETFKQHQLAFPENFHRSPEFNNYYLKIYSFDRGDWSNEMPISPRIDFILNIESTDQAFYALRNDDFLGEEQEYLTFYKLRLIQK